MDLSKLSDAELDALEAQVKSGPKDAPKEGSFVKDLGHGTRLLARSALQGVTALPGMLSDALITRPLNHFAGTKIPLSQEAVGKFADEFGLDRPQGSGEQVLSDIASTVTGIGGQAKVGEKMTEQGGPMAKALGEFLSQRLGLQMASGAAGAGSASAVKEAGGSPGMQATAGLLGGMAPVAASAAARPVLDTASKLGEGFAAGWGNSSSAQDAIKSRALARVLGERRGAVANALENAPRQYVQGSNPTSAEIAVPAGSTEFSALEKMLARKYDPSGLNDIERSQEGARQSVIAGAQQWAAAHGINPNQIHLPRVAADMARSQDNSAMARKGGEAVRTGLEEVFNPVEPPGMLHRGVMLARAILEHAQGGARQKSMTGLTQEMLHDPDKIRELLMAVRAQQQQGLGLAPFTAAQQQVIAGE